MRVSNALRRGLSILEAVAGRFSIVETVVACALIVLLAMLVLPAIERARGSAIANHSKDNLRRIGIGMHTYHATHNSFPAASGQSPK